MKNILFFLFGFLLVSIVSCNTVPETSESSVKQDLEPALIEFAELEHDFGKVTEGIDIVENEGKFKGKFSISTGRWRPVAYTRHAVNTSL